MCGICGKLSFSPPIPVDGELLHRMCEVMRHRGPDDSGIYLKGCVGLGIRRLSIIDLDTGHQPISNEDESVWIVLNGEIYNFVELRRELEAKGHRFRTNTDTEVIVHLYEDFGEGCVQKLRGMFAFAIWDAREQKLFLARDRIGQKPLYYAIVNGSLIFGSEIKAILQDPEIERRINWEALDDYLTHLFVPSPKTIFQGIHKLPPAHYLTCKDGRIKIERYWRVTYRSDENKGEAFYAQRLAELLQESVKLRLVSDVPLGAFLSGGLDSSLVVAMMSGLSNRPVKTFSIGFKESSYNELRYARLVAEHFGTDHREFEVTCDVVDLLPKLVWHFDEPFADSSAIPTYYVSKMTRQHVTVALSGDAGDEVFAGYRRYQARRMAQYFNLLPKWARRELIGSVVKRLPEPTSYYGASYVKKVKRFVEYAATVDENERTSWAPLFTAKQKDRLYSSQLKGHLSSYRESSQFLNQYFDQAYNEDMVAKMMWVDLMTYLPGDILTKVDRMSMAVSLEARAPFLDHKLVEFAAEIPTALKLKGLSTKYILKRSMSELLPKEIIRRSKQGFVVPMASWLKDQLSQCIEDLLLSETSIGRRYFNPRYIEGMVKEHREGRQDYSQHIWALLIFEVWHRMFTGGGA